MKKNPSVNFIMFDTELLMWVGEKDRRYHNGDKMKRGIISYTEALHDLGFYFKKICTGELRVGSQPLSAWARSWGWDYRKTVRFVTIVLRALFDLNDALKKAKVLKERLEAAYRRQKEKATNYIRRIRGTIISDNNIVEDDESDDERLFLDAMAALAKTNPVHYRATIKEKLKAGDQVTVANFQSWLQKNLKKEISSIDSTEVEKTLKTKLVLGYKVIDFYKKDENLYHLVFENCFENDMTAEQIIENAK